MSVKFELDFRMITQKMKFLILGQPPRSVLHRSVAQSYPALCSCSDIRDIINDIYWNPLLSDSLDI